MSGLRAHFPTRLGHECLVALHDPRQADREGRALARLAFHRDVAAHQAAEMPADGKAKAGAAVFAGGRGVGLRKFLEQPTHLLFGHADPGIGDGNHDRIAAIDLLRLRGNGDGTVFRELVGIARQVEQRLPEAGLVGVHRAQVSRTIDYDPIGVLRRHRFDRLGHVLDQGGQRERFEVKLHSPRLDLRQVEDVVDQGKQVAGGAQHPIERLDFVLALEIAGVLHQHLGNADDGVERRAQLVRHVGEEARFGSVGFVGSIARGSELGFVLFQSGDVRIDRNDTTISGFSFADLDPTAVAAALDVRFARGAVAREAFRNPRLAASLGILDQAALGSHAQNCFEAGAGHHHLGVGCKELSIMAIADDELERRKAKTLRIWSRSHR
jgi:hypothetical protein